MSFEDIPLWLSFTVRHLAYTTCLPARYAVRSNTTTIVAAIRMVVELCSRNFTFMLVAHGAAAAHTRNSIRCI